MSNNLDAEAVFQKRKIGVIFPEQIGDDAIVLKGYDKTLGRWEG